MWLYSEIIFNIKPDFIIETGTALGGSALFMANMLDLIGKGRVISIDIDDKPRPQHPRITYLSGSSVSDEIIKRVEGTIKENDKVILVILDSDHSKSHVLKELEIYSRFVSKNSYMIVEDTHLNNPIIDRNYPAGNSPLDAVREFVGHNRDFIIDKNMCKFLMTWNPDGYLRRIK